MALTPKTKLSLTLGTAIAIIIFVAKATWWVSETKQELSAKMDRTYKAVQRLDVSAWHIADQTAFAYRLQIRNPPDKIKNGEFNVPDIGEILRERYSSEADEPAGVAKRVQ
jgi:hypothetical protein